MSDKDKTQKATRREFIELLAAGSVGATAAGLGAGSIVDQAQAETRTADRSSYKIFSPGRIG